MLKRKKDINNPTFFEWENEEIKSALFLLKISKK